MAVEAGHQLKDRLAHRINQSGLLFECWVGFQNPVVDRPPSRVGDNFDDAQPLVDGVEQVAIALLAVPDCVGSGLGFLPSRLLAQ